MTGDDHDSLEAVLDLAEEALSRGDTQGAKDLCDEVLRRDPANTGALFLTAEAHRDARDIERAEGCYRRVIHIDAAHSASWSGLGAVLFDQLRFEEARRAANRAIRVAPDNAEAYYLRAMMRERRGDFDGADRDFRRAYRGDPDGFPRPVPLSDAMVESVVQDALRSMHPSIRQYLSQVPILLEEVPDEETCRQWDPPMPPGEIVGYFSGPSLMDRSVEDPWSNLPSAIVLYRRNLARIAWDPARLVEELQVTVFHEVGHFLGLDEDDLRARGLD